MPRRARWCKPKFPDLELPSICQAILILRASFFNDSPAMEMAFSSKLFAFTVGAGLALMSTAALAGAPSRQDAQRAILHYLNWDDGKTNAKFTSMSIGSPHAANAQEAAQVQVDLGQVVYPVATTYTTIAGSGPSAYIRDYTAHYYVYWKPSGGWDATTNSQLGDGNHLRGT
jgi:hypothetical protein